MALDSPCLSRVEDHSQQPALPEASRLPGTRAPVLIIPRQHMQRLLAKASSSVQQQHTRAQQAVAEASTPIASPLSLSPSLSTSPQLTSVPASPSQLNSTDRLTYKLDQQQQLQLKPLPPLAHHTPIHRRVEDRLSVAASLLESPLIVSPALTPTPQPTSVLASPHQFNSTDSLTNE